jgi:hypothetical protein
LQLIMLHIPAMQYVIRPIIIRMKIVIHVIQRVEEDRL